MCLPTDGLTRRKFDVSWIVHRRSFSEEVGRRASVCILRYRLTRTGNTSYGKEIAFLLQMRIFESHCKSPQNGASSCDRHRLTAAQQLCSAQTSDCSRLDQGSEALSKGRSISLSALLSNTSRSSEGTWFAHQNGRTFRSVCLQVSSRKNEATGFSSILE